MSYSNTIVAIDNIAIEYEMSENDYYYLDDSSAARKRRRLSHLSTNEKVLQRLAHDFFYLTNYFFICFTLTLKKHILILFYTISSRHTWCLVQTSG